MGEKITTIELTTTNPDKWLFVNTETGEVWRWEAGEFQPETARSVRQALAAEAPEEYKKGRVE